METISIIIPAYQAAKTICGTIESVIRFGNSISEIIVIDDGSTDGTGGLVETSFDDARIRVISKLNGGRSSARNRGIAEATGDWIMFVDADDRICSDVLGRFLRRKDHSRYDLVYFPFTKETSESDVHVDKRKVTTANNIADIMVCEERHSSLHSIYELNSCWAKLYRREVLVEGEGDPGIFFPVGVRFSEDKLFNLEFLNRLGDSMVLFMDGDPLYQWNTEGSGTVGTIRPTDIDNVSAYARAVFALAEKKKILSHQAKPLLSEEIMLQFARSIKAEDFEHAQVEQHWKNVLSDNGVLDTLNEIPAELCGAFGYKRPIVWLLKHEQVGAALTFCRFLWKIKSVGKGVLSYRA